MSDAVLNTGDLTNKMPIKIKRELFEDLEVLDINSKGAGVVKSKDGKVIFVHGVVPGDRVTIEI